MIAAVYVRVSTEGQEKDGTSLGTQLEACLRKAEELGHEVPPQYVFRETYTGIELDRAELTKLRGVVRQHEVQVVICYSTDRLSRKALHVAMLAEEFQRRKVELVFVTEPLDSSPEGQLIQYVKGYAAELEREKIRDRSQRGIKARAASGKLPNGSHCRCYGYNYDKRTGTRTINEEQATWVRRMFEWAHDGVSPRQIALKMTELKVPRYNGTTFWDRTYVGHLLRREQYIGKTYFNTMLRIEPQYKIKTVTKGKKSSQRYKPRDQWIEIPGATPPILSQELFDDVQLKLDDRRKHHGVAPKREYLLKGMIICGECGGRYSGTFRRYVHKHDPETQYYCPRRVRGVAKEICRSRILRGRDIESLVWDVVKKLLADPDMVYRHMLEKRQAGNNSEYWLAELERIEVMFNSLRSQEKKLLQAAKFGFEEDLVLAEKESIDAQRLMLTREKASVLKQIELARDLDVDLESVRRFCRRVSKKVDSASFEDKRQMLDVLKMKVIVGPGQLTIRGFLPELPTEDKKNPVGLEFAIEAG